MTCKNCLHYEACRDTYDEMAYENKTYDFEFDEKDYARTGCHNFTDCSEWVHLLCKVGDKVWYITRVNNNNLIKPAIIKKIVTDDKRVRGLYVFGDGRNFESSFDNFYLTYKEAEKALERYK